MRLLIVEDDPLYLTHLVEITKPWDYDILTAVNGLDAWHLINQSPAEPHLILLDWTMPELDGYDLCRKIKAMKNQHMYYVVMLTSKGHIEDLTASLDAGADDYIVKPAHPKELRSRLTAGRRILDCQYMMSQLTNELIQVNKELQRMVAVDGLTNIANRRHFDERFDGEWRRAIREQNFLSLLLIDLDYFKQYNDTYGHLAGDGCLKQVASILSTTASRAGDLVARYGGEEFVVLLPNTDAVGASVVAESLRCAISDLHIPHEKSPHPCLTASIGMATVMPQSATSPSELLAQADQALYRAKQSGKNIVRK
jgi:diguanylate cyclase (GGDEF)-like protein